MTEQINQETTKKWLNVENYNIFKITLIPFLIYFKQFFQFIFITIIPELLIFGIFWEVQIFFTYDPASSMFNFRLDFRDEFGQTYLIPLIIIATLLFILRSGIITSLSWKTIEEGSANPIWAIKHTLKRIKEIFLATIILIFFLFVPGFIFLLAMVFGLRMPGLMWIMITIAVGLPVLLGSRICLFNVGITKDELPVGTAFQKSWDLTTKLNYMKTILFLIIYTFLALILPFLLTSYLNNIVGQWTGFVMIFIRTLMYPLMDITLSVIYIHSEHDSINRAVFREDILKQKQRSEMLYGKLEKKY